MRALLQRVKKASVTVNGGTVAHINKGLLVFIGINKNDRTADSDFLVDKITNLRVFENEKGKFDLSVREIKGDILLVPQFTLYGKCVKGRRPDFTDAAPIDIAAKIYQDTVAAFMKTGLKVESGIFQAHMEVHLVNDGPVTLMIESQQSLKK